MPVSLSKTVYTPSIFSTNTNLAPTGIDLFKLATSGTTTVGAGVALGALAAGTTALTAEVVDTGFLTVVLLVDTVLLIGRVAGLETLAVFSIGVIAAGAEVA